MATPKNEQHNEPKTAEEVMADTLRDWRSEQRQGYVAHVVDGRIEGAEGALVYYGHPFQGNPWRTTRVNPYDGKEHPCEPYVDVSRLSTHLGGCPVTWIAWDEATGCNVYARA